MKKVEVNQGSSTTLRSGIRSGSPQDVVEDERKNWEEVWHAFQDTAGAPWRTAKVDEQPLVRPTLEEARRCAAAFKENTSIGVCSIRPRWFGWLSDDVTEMRIDLLMAV